MSEYWKSTPKYLCKYCDAFVRDTKLERTNHEATGRHQGAVKRFLRDLHRSAANEDREKERARREIDRLNGVAPTPFHSDAQPEQKQKQERGAYEKPDVSSTASAADCRAQMEQLAELGVSIPTEFRGDLALAGEWSTTSERVIRRKVKPSGDAVSEEDNESKKRVQTEEEQEEEDAMQGLFKRPKTARWGRDSRKIGGVGDEADLDALLGAITSERKDVDVKEETKPDVKVEDGIKTKGTKQEEGIKIEEGVKSEGELVPAVPVVKPDPTADDSKLSLDDIPSQAEPAGGGSEAPVTVVFKKRKAKNMRQK